MRSFHLQRWVKINIDNREGQIRVVLCYSVPGHHRISSLRTFQTPSLFRFVPIPKSDSSKCASQSGGFGTRPVRSSSGVKISIQGEETWMPNARLNGPPSTPA